VGWKSKDLTLVPEGGICIAVPHAVMKSLVILANGDRPSETKPSTATFIYFGGGYRSEEVINMNNEKPDETQPETFQEKKLPTSMPAVKYEDVKLSDILLKAGMVGSNSEYRRLIRDGAIEVNSKVIGDPNFKPHPGSIIKIGKKKFIKIRAK